MNGSSTIVLLADLLLDMVSTSPTPAPMIIVEGNRIVAIGRQGEMGIPSGARVITCEGLTLLPGLIDAHTHVQMDGKAWVPSEIAARSDARLFEQSMSNVRTALDSGVTTLRDNAARPAPIFRLKQALEQGQLIGPRLQACGAAITIPDGHCWFLGATIADDTQIVPAVYNQILHGADFIKVMATGGNMTPTSSPREAQFSVRQMRLIVEQARQHGCLVTAHAHGTAGIRHCVEGGLDSIDHCSWLGAETGFDYDPELVERMVEQDMYVIPTLSVIFERCSRQPALWEQRLANLNRMIQSGVTLVAGTDAGTRDVPFGQPWREIELLAEAGLSNFQAIEAATRGAAQCLGMDEEIGSIEVGKEADLIAVAGNPLRDVGALSRVKMVMKAGRLIPYENEERG